MAVPHELRLAGLGLFDVEGNWTSSAVTSKFPVSSSGSASWDGSALQGTGLPLSVVLFISGRYVWERQTSAEYLAVFG